jgi:hypothetical protein
VLRKKTINTPSESNRRSRVKRAFAEFFDNRTLTSDVFVDLVIDHLAARGLTDPKLLYETPVRDFDTKEGVFGHSDMVRTVPILRDIEPEFAAWNSSQEGLAS